MLAGRTQTVRLIGIDAPEVSPNDRARDQARMLGVPLRELLDLGRRSLDFASRLAPHPHGFDRDRDGIGCER